MPFNLGFSEIVVILLIVLLLFGAKRLPEIGGAMAKSIREFKHGLKDMQNDIEGSSRSERQQTSPRRLAQRDESSSLEGRASVEEHRTPLESTQG